MYANEAPKPVMGTGLRRAQRDGKNYGSQIGRSCQNHILHLRWPPQGFQFMRESLLFPAHYV